METGHTRNVAHFFGLKTLCTSFGGRYNPTNTDILLTALDTAYTNYDTLVKAVKSPYETWADAVDTRHLNFVDLKHIARSSLRQLKASQNVTPGDVNRAQTLVDEITGANIQKRPPHNPDDATGHVSVSHQSYDQMLGHFNDLIVVYQSSAYATNEPGLDIPSLQTFATTLLTANQNVTTTAIPYKNALVARDTALYQKKELNPTSLWALIHAVKDYIQGSDAFNQTEKKATAHISFNRPDQKHLHF